MDTAQEQLEALYDMMWSIDPHLNLDLESKIMQIEDNEVRLSLLSTLEQLREGKELNNRELFELGYIIGDYMKRRSNGNK